MINLGKITQGERGTISFTWEFPDYITSPASISGATITATMTDEDGTTTAVSGTLTGTAATTCTWALSAGDSGTAGTFTVLFKAIVSGVTTYTLQATLEVIANPEVTGTQNDPLVSIPTDDAAWVATSADGGALGTAAYAATGDFDAAGSAAAAQAAAIASLGGADGTVTDEQLRNWAGQALALMTSVTRTDYRKSWVGVDGRTKYAGWIQVTGTVTWPDGVTGHLDGVEYPEAPGVLQYFTASHVASGKIVVQSPLTNGAAGYTVVTPDYYVDSAAAGGGDGSLATPLNSVATMPTLQSGDVVALKSGSTWLESFDFSDGVPASIYRYGTGNKPILDARNTIAADSWSLYGAGAGSTYQASITWAGSQSGIVVSLVPAWEDDTRAKQGSGAATLNAGEYYVANASTGSGTIYFRASDDGDLSAGAHVIKYAARHGGLSTTQSNGGLISGCVFDGIHTIGGTADGGSIVGGRSMILRHCVAQDGGKHNIYTNDGVTMLGCVLDDAWYNGSLSLFVLNENTPAQLTNTIDACAFVLSEILASSNAIYGHQNVSGTFGPLSVTRCYSDKATLCSVTEIDAVTIDKCYVRDATFGLLALSQTIRDSIVEPVTATPLLASVSAVNLTIKFIGCKYTIGTGTTTNGAINWSQTGCTLEFRDMVWDSLATGGISRAIYPLTASTTIVVNNCQFLVSGGYGYWTIFASALAPTLAVNNNTYRVQNWRYDNIQYNTIADWRTATGQDGASIAY